MGFTALTTGGSSGLLPRFMETRGITSGCRNSGTSIQAFVGTDGRASINTSAA